MRKDGKKLVFIKATGSYENMGQLAGTEAGGREQGPAAHGWGGGEPSSAQEAACQFGALGEGLGHGSPGQCSFPVITEFHEYFSNQNVCLGVFWVKISSRQDWETHTGCLGSGEVVTVQVTRKLPGVQFSLNPGLFLRNE